MWRNVRWWPNGVNIRKTVALTKLVWHGQYSVLASGVRSLHPKDRVGKGVRT